MILTQPILKARLGGVQTSIAWATFEPFAKAAERNFRDRIGKELFSFLEKLEDTKAEEFALRELAEAAIAWEALIRALPHLKLRIGDMGLMKTSPPGTVAVTKWEYIDTADAAQKEADDHLEDFFKELESVRPAVWTSSTAYKLRQKHFIRSSDELSQFVSLGGGRNGRFFDMMVPYIARAEELYIEPILTESDFSTLLEKWQDPAASWSRKEEKVIELIQKVVAAMAYFEAFPFLPLQVDYKSFSSPRSKDGITEEREPDPNDVSFLQRQLYKDGQLYAVKLKEQLDKVASPELFPGYFDAFLKATSPEEPEDYTHTSHVII